MKFHRPDAEIFIPDHAELTDALPRITHLGIGAHQDDLEFMAFHGILACFDRKDRWFGGVTCTDGAGSSRSGPYAGYSDDRMMEVRRREQNSAAAIGGYGVMIQLAHSSGAVKSLTANELIGDLGQILAATLPEVVYTHNPADKHETHIGVAVAALRAIRALPADLRPKQLIGCEVWRSLDWLADGDKVVMDVSERRNLAAALNGVFDSQISGGKRYDLATLGRRAANATFFNALATDAASQVIFGMDLTPLVQDESLDLGTFVGDLIEKFQADVAGKLAAHHGSVSGPA